MQRLGATEDGAEPLECHADEVDLGLLRSQLHTRRLRVEAQHEALRVLGTELLTHDPRPDPSGSAELRNLLEQRRARDEEEGQPRGDVVDVEPGRDGGTDVLLGVGEGEGDLLRGRRPGLGHVVTADGDGVPARHLLVAVGEDVADEAQGLLRRVDVGAAGDVLLEHVVLDRPGELGALGAVLLGDELVHQQQRRCRRVDGHRRRHLAQRQATEQRPHVVDRVDGDTDLADLAAARSPRRSRSPSGSAGRRRRTARRCRWRRAGGSARCTPWRCRTRRTGASSRAARCTCSGRRRGCRGTAPARPAAPRGRTPRGRPRRTRP